MRYLAILACLALFMSALPARAGQTMTVEEAYKAIPHARTVFDSTQGQMGADEKAFLDKFFQLVDLAVVERVAAMQAISSGRAVTFNYAGIESSLMALDVPDKLKTAHALVMQAVAEHRQYLEKWKASGGAFNISDPLISSSSAKLVQAYSELMAAYPAEGAHNKQAFFDHLCALDFK
jgi:hypothetical protein